MTEAAGTIALFALFVLAGELLPVRVVRRGDGGEITLSSPFALALIPLAGLAPATVVLAIASALADVAGGKAWHKTLFNVAQYTLSMLVAGSVYQVLGMPWFARLGFGDPAFAVLAAALAFFVANLLLTAGVMATSRGVPIRTFLWRDLRFQLSVMGALTAMTPMVLLVAQRSLWLVPLLVVPAVAVHQSARLSLEKEHEALHDGLTGLPNRTLFAGLLAESLVTAENAGHGVAVLFVDLDRFREVNDTLGHDTGDRLLQLVGPRLRIIGGPGATVGRLGGDEFAVLLPALPESSEAARYAARMLRVLSEPFRVGDWSLAVEAHVGVAVYPDHALTADELLRRADVALYLAKEHRSGAELYSAERDTHGRRRLGLLSDLRRAIEERELLLHYQPKADLRKGHISGVEALLRWQHPVHGLIGPDEFIPLAEHTALMEPLTVFVLEQALTQCRLWRVAELDLRVAVNLSVRNLYDVGLAERIGGMLRERQLPVDALELEITESAIMADPGRALETLYALHGLGVRLAIDDFGTGHSSLSYLKRLPVDQVKIDQSFVQGLTSDASDAAIVRSTIDLSRHLGLEVVGEGVESAAVWEALSGLGCDFLQGDYLSPALSADALAPGLRKGFRGLRALSETGL